MTDRHGRRNLAYMSPSGAVKWLIIANISAYAVQSLTGGIYTGVFGLVPRSVFSNLWLWQPVTYMFLHGGMFHLLINLFILWMFGRNIENEWGTASFLKYYFTCGIGAGLFITLASPGSVIPSIGASGAIYGLLVAFGMLYPESVIYLYFFLPLKAKYLALVLGLMAFFSGLSGAEPNVSHLGHLGGLVIGYVYLKLQSKGNFSMFISRLRNSFTGKRFRVIHPGAGETPEDRVNKILDRIITSGAESLTEDEKRTMDEYMKSKGGRA